MIKILTFVQYCRMNAILHKTRKLFHMWEIAQIIHEISNILPYCWVTKMMEPYLGKPKKRDSTQKPTCFSTSQLNLITQVPLHGAGYVLVMSHSLRKSPIPCLGDERRREFSDDWRHGGNKLHVKRDIKRFNGKRRNLVQSADCVGLVNSTYSTAIPDIRFFFFNKTMHFKTNLSARRITVKIQTRNIHNKKCALKYSD